MSSRIPALAAALLFACAACGSSATSSGPSQPAHAPSDPSSPTAGADTCAGYRVTDGCMNETNFAQCRARETECPGAVLVLESCPAQFACP